MSVISRRIFSSMMLLDPAISPPEVGLDGLGFDYMTLRRRTHWPNREAAEKSVRKMFSTWDSKVIDLFMEFAIKNDDNTASKGPSSTQSVSLVTEQYHELVNYLKPTFVHGDNTKEPELVYQTGLVDMFHMLGHITCSTFFLCGGRDTPSDDDIRDYWQTRTCALQYAKQPGERRRVDVKVLPELGHFLAMEDPKTCAEVMANWMAVELNL
ncbi:hypothetical protein COL154_010031 [Colletotrichum chrysophilum]|nr:hypothetical protein COL154_010031 [Colletotrichum chrysophilum]